MRPRSLSRSLGRFAALVLVSVLVASGGIGISTGVAAVGSAHGAAVAPPASPRPAAGGPAAASHDRSVERDLHADAFAPPADSRGVAGRVGRWPGHTIRYWAKVPKNYEWALEVAVSGWNRTGLNMTFVRSSRARAQTRITMGDTRGSAGFATIGHQASNWVHLAPGQLKPWYQPSRELASLQLLVLGHIIAHELGHNLGLDHRERPACGLMTPILYVNDCPPLDPDRIGYYECRIIDRPSLATTVTWYGGTRKLAPASCPLDRVPAQLGDARVSGGLDADEAVSITWQPPSRVEPGSKVEILRWADCNFPVVQDFFGVAMRKDGMIQAQVDPGSGSWTEPDKDLRTYCYGAQIVNKSGAGPQAISKVLTNWAPAPPAPTVSDARRHIDTPGEVLATVSWNHTHDLAALVRPEGACATTWPAGTDPSDHLVHQQDGLVPVMIGDLVDPCLSFFTVSTESGRVSKSGAIRQLGPEPLSGPPVVTSVRRVSGSDSYDVAAAWDERFTRVLVLSRAEGDCVSSWPAGLDPSSYEVSGGDGQLDVDAPGLTRPCFSFFTENAQGVPSQSSVVWQVPVAPAPGAPTVTSVSRSGATPGQVDVIATFDRATFRLAGIVAPTDECVETWPTGENPQYYLADFVTEDAPTGQLYAAQTTRPCVTLFLVNDDGLVGPGTVRQLAAAPAPPVPAVSAVTALGGGDFDAAVSLDARFGLLVLDAPQSQCATTIPAGDDPFWYLAWPEAGHLYLYSAEAHPCFSFFAVNADGVVGAVKTVQK